MRQKYDMLFKMHIQSNSQEKSTLSTELSTVFHRQKPVKAGFFGVIPMNLVYSSVDEGELSTDYGRYALRNFGIKSVFVPLLG